MFGKMMNSFYYGKSGKGDYNKEDLPKNRWQLFFEMLKVRLTGLVRLNLIYVLCWVPMIVLAMMTLMAWINGAMDETALADVAQFSVFSSQLIFSGLVLAIPCLFITGPWTAGIAYVTRNWARDEHSFVWSDYKDAMKENWKQALITSAITGIMPFLVYVGYLTYGQLITKMGAFFIIPQVFLLLVGGIWSLMLIYIYPLMVSYQLTYGQLLKNALLLAVGRLPQSIGLRLMSLVPIAVGLAAVLLTGQIAVVMLILVALYALFLLAFDRFAYASYSNGVFDKYINSRIEGVEVNRGLSDEEDDFDDEDDDDIQQ